LECLIRFITAAVNKSLQTTRNACDLFVKTLNWLKNIEISSNFLPLTIQYFL